VSSAELADPPKNPVHRGFMRELQICQVAGSAQEVDVGVVEARDNEAPGGVQDDRSGAGEWANLGI
jgi:hypothetical protein